MHRIFGVTSVTSSVEYQLQQIGDRTQTAYLAIIQVTGNVTDGTFCTPFRTDLSTLNPLLGEGVLS